jgi:hypothetical protein
MFERKISWGCGWFKFFLPYSFLLIRYFICDLVSLPLADSQCLYSPFLNSKIPEHSK